MSSRSGPVEEGYQRRVEERESSVGGRARPRLLHSFVYGCPYAYTFTICLHIYIFTHLRVFMCLCTLICACGIYYILCIVYFILYRYTYAYLFIYLVLYIFLYQSIYLATSATLVSARTGRWNADGSQASAAGIGWGLLGVSDAIPPGAHMHCRHPGDSCCLGSASELTGGPYEGRP